MQKAMGWLLTAIFAAIFLTVALPLLADLFVWALSAIIVVAFVMFVIKLLFRGGKSKPTHHHHYYHR